MLRTLLTEEVRVLGSIHAKTVGVLAVAGAGALAVGLVLHVMGAHTPALMAVVGAIIAFLLPAPIIAVHGLAEYWLSVHGRRGYLTMSLPARGREVFAAKVLYLLAAVLAGLLATLVGLVAVVLAHAWMQEMTPAQVWDGVLGVLDGMGATTVWTIIGVIVLQMLSVVVMWACVMSIAAQTRWNHLGFGGVVIGMGLLYLACQVLFAASTLLLPLGLEMATGELVARSMLPELLAGTDQPSVVGLGFMPASVLICVALAWWAVRSLERHASLR